MAASGAMRILEKLPRRNCLVVLNYHRIGSRSDTVGDPNLYSATPGDLDEQITWLKSRYHIASLDEAIRFVEGRTAFPDAAILITFDDGYKDNFDYAYPILRNHKVQGTFFICTSYIGSQQLPWWDRIAYMVRNSRSEQLTLNYPERLNFDLSSNKLATINRLLSIYKSGHAIDKERFMKEISRATGVEREPSDQRLFINQHELREMAQNGMAIGSHTHSHPLLSHLPKDLQLEEVLLSKRILERETERKIQSIAYPVGSSDSFDQRTHEALRQAGYRIAFSFYGGKNIAGKIPPFDVKRHHVGLGEGASLFRVRAATSAILGQPLL